MPALSLDATGTPLFFAVDGTSTLTSALEDTPTDFGTVDDLEYTISWELDGTYSDDEYVLQVRIVSGATILAAQDAGGTFQLVVSRSSEPSSIGTENASFNYVNTAAGKTAWDGATVQVRQLYLANLSADNCAYKVNSVVFDGNYTSEGVAVSAGTAQLSLTTLQAELINEIVVDGNFIELSLVAYPAVVTTFFQVLVDDPAPLSITTAAATIQEGSQIVTDSPIEFSLDTEDASIQIVPGGVYVIDTVPYSLDPTKPSVTYGTPTVVDAEVVELQLTVAAAIVKDFLSSELSKPYLAYWNSVRNANWDDEVVDVIFEGPSPNAEWD